MHKSDNTILIWVLSWAGVLLALLYSPFGSPDLYHPRKYFTENQGVNFNKITIKNEPRKESQASDADAELGVDITQSKRSKNFNYAVSGGGVRSISKNISSINIRTTRKNFGKQLSNTSGSSSGGSSSSSGKSGNRGGRDNNFSASSSSIGNSSNVVGGALVAKADLSLFSDSTALASEYSRQNAGGVDLGLEDPTADPIPVGDGWIFLISIALIYGIKIHLNKKKNERKLAVLNL